MVNKLKLLKHTPQITTANLISADDQAGVKIAEKPLPAQTNVGDLTLQMFGSPSAAIDIRVEIVKEGSVLTGLYKLSSDGGSTYKGRKETGAFDDAQGGTAGEGSKIWDEAEPITFSKPVFYDTDDDGLANEIVILMYQATTGKMQIHSADLDGYSNWTTEGSPRYERTSITTTGVPRFALVERENILYKFWQSGGVVYSASSNNGGSSWASPVAVSATNHGSNASVCACVNRLNNWLMLTVADTTAVGRLHVYGSADGRTWYGPNLGGSTSTVYYYPDMVHDKYNGKTLIVADDNGSLKVHGFQNTDSRPWVTETWASYSETFGFSSASYTVPSITIAPDASVWVAAQHVGGSVDYAKSPPGGAGTWSEETEALNYGTGTPQYANITCLGGQLYVPHLRYIGAADQDPHIGHHKYWQSSYIEGTASGIVFTGSGTNDLTKAEYALYTGTDPTVTYTVRTATSGTSYRFKDNFDANYSGTTGFHTTQQSLDRGISIAFGTSGNHEALSTWEFSYTKGNGSWLGEDNQLQYLSDDDVWVSWGGEYGAAGDYWDQGAGYDYGAINILKGIPSVGWRTTTTESGTPITAVYGTDNKLFKMNAVHLDGCNLSKLRVQANRSDSWSTPLLSATVDFATGTTGIIGSMGASFITDNNANYRPNKLIDRLVRMSDGVGSGNLYRVTENSNFELLFSATSLHTDGVTAGDSFVLVNNKAWHEFGSSARVSHIKLTIPANSYSPDSFHKVGSGVFGELLNLSRYPNINAERSDIHTESLVVSTGGKLSSYKIGTPRRSFSYTFGNLNASEKENIANYFKLYGYRSTAMAILDTDGDPYLVRLTNDNISWQGKPADNFDLTSLTFEEQT